MIDHYPNKALGQHWLADPQKLSAICDNADITKGDKVLEIGPGQGTLTAELLSRGAEVLALEYDPALAKNLVRNLSRLTAQQLGNLKVFHADIRKFDFTTVPHNYKIVSNIPYYLTSNLVGMLCDLTNPPTQAALLMQKEVAERIAADKKRSLLSVIAQYSYECGLGEFVGRLMFDPPPKVDSQVLILKLREKPVFEADKKRLYLLFKAAFSEKRKNLRNALSGGLRIDKSAAESLLSSAQIGFDRRAESLTWNEWESLYGCFSNLEIT